MDIKKGIDRQVIKMKLDNSPLFDVAINEFEEMSFQMEMDIATLNDAIFNYLSVSRRYNDNNKIVNVPHIH